MEPEANLDEYVVILGGTGFDPKFPRVRTGIGLVKTSLAAGGTRKYVAVCGMGKENGEAEYQFLSRCALTRGLLPQNVVTVKSSEKDRSHRNEIKCALQYIFFRSENRPVKVFFVTEGLLHALRVKIYAYCQRPKHMAVGIECVDSGEKLTWKRRLREVRSFAKCLWWVVWQWKR